jgi:hypothetical protein
MTELSRDDYSGYEPDPLFIDSLLEAKWILLMWFACMAWTLAVCLTQGYQKNVTPETFSMVLGIPAWVAYGICLPWCLANLATFVFCLGYMKDADLGEEYSATDSTSVSTGANHV